MKKLESALARAKNLGSGGGYGHWIKQKISAVIMLLMTCWIAYFVLSLQGGSLEDVIALATTGANGFAMVFTICCALYHSAIGMQVVIEDYISCIFLRNAMIIALKIFSFVSGSAFVYAFFYLQFELIRTS